MSDVWTQGALNRIADALEWHKQRIIEQDEREEAKRERDKQEALEMNKALVQQMVESVAEQQRRAFAEHEARYHCGPELPKVVQ